MLVLEAMPANMERLGLKDKFGFARMTSLKMLVCVNQLFKSPSKKYFKKSEKMGYALR